MCGICGIVEFDGKPVAWAAVKSMADTLEHRGPDDAGYHFEPGVGLGHRRLSIIDVDGGHQPLANEDGTVWAIFNGEIYNYTELRALLISKGHRFRSKSDTEVIVHLYEEVGESCFGQLRGMFAIAIWDSRRRQLILARDRIGKKPLFYHHDGPRVTFASELKAILAAGAEDGGLNASALADYFTFLYIPAPGTIYRRIRKVRPAHYMSFSETGVHDHEYWDLRFGNVEEKSEGEWCAEINDALKESVRIRMMSEVPLGSFLSGGVDSSAVVACMSQLVEVPVTTCTVGFDEAGYSEIQHARRVAQHVGSDYHEAIVRPSAAEIVTRLAWHYDEPFADSSAIPTYYVSRAARQHVTVALSGDGGDESFAGYKRYGYELADNRLRSLFPPSFRRTALRRLGQWYPPLEHAPRLFRAKSLLQRLGDDPLEGYLARITAPRWVRESILSDDLKSGLRGYDPLEQFRDHYRRADSADFLSRIQYLDIKTYLTDDICVKVDRASMAVSLEVRAPLLDHRFMELAARIPAPLKLKNGSGKYIFKKAVGPMLPPEILSRPKQGFGVPIAEWFRGELREQAQHTLLMNDGLLDLDCLRRLWKRHQGEVQDHSAVLWAAFMFRQWQTTFQHCLPLDQKPAVSLARS
ncbi:MAG TPA: asparagine synthase (glutamine-hydrolyzing) [Terriglobales bacterium]|nr:asparagine synthase (glutamine-hydrolyzing) [Terriglobales bacterium]